MSTVYKASILFVFTLGSQRGAVIVMLKNTSRSAGATRGGVLLGLGVSAPHRGFEQSRRDYLKSLGCVLLHLKKGSLQ